MTKNIDLSKTNSKSFNQTKAAIQKYAEILTKIKSNLLPHTKNSEEHSLKFFANGFTTTPMLIKSDSGTETLEMNLNLNLNELEIKIGKDAFSVGLLKSDIESFVIEFKEIFTNFSLPTQLLENLTHNDHKLNYSLADADLIWTILSSNYFTFVDFKASIMNETSNVNFWPHHFDIAMLIFSGKIIEGQDISNWSYSREQMNFGFLLGDENINTPYFYATVYPFDNHLLETNLKNGGYWYQENWNGAILELESVTDDIIQSKKIIEFFNEVRNLAWK